MTIQCAPASSVETNACQVGGTNDCSQDRLFVHSPCGCLVKICVSCYMASLAPLHVCAFCRQPIFWFPSLISPGLYTPLFNIFLFLKFICFDHLSTFHYANKLRIRNPKKLRKRKLSKNCEAKAKRKRSEVESILCFFAIVRIRIANFEPWLKWINSFKQKKEFYSLNDIEMIAEDDFFFVNDQVTQFSSIIKLSIL